MTNMAEVIDYAVRDGYWGYEGGFRLLESVNGTWTYESSLDPSVSADPFRPLVTRWADVAVAHARIRRVDGRFTADVVGVAGAWASGLNEQSARMALHEVLVDWAQMKLSDGDKDIPQMEGIQLVQGT